MRDRATIQTHLGQAVKQLRAARELTQEELSRLTGLHPTYLSDIERGARNPSFITLVRLTAGLDASLTELTGAYERHTRGKSR
jgi:transcriptional regulator with XRE-family HTH domain